MKDGHDNDDDDEDLKFQLPHSSSRWKKRLYSFLHDKLKFPGVVYRPAFLVHSWDLQYLQLAFVSFSSILESVKLVTPGKERVGGGTGGGLTPSMPPVSSAMYLCFWLVRCLTACYAYSIFNEDFRELPGTLNADRFDRDIRAGQF
ncbi:hypothetical protein TSUD_157280 [Trifolium subterraneum]|uniref:SAYSvFN domain-containing protein n=1 Tax=Trifolium subterraneum TaxID=3900 RepID=A0A2Z6MMW9_TRISU|nr:hypothetical protein TSUD_157280 [Trifolium subterraneum]